MVKGDLGGESSFKGQTNRLWLYQNSVGEIILKNSRKSIVVLENKRPL